MLAESLPYVSGALALGFAYGRFRKIGKNNGRHTLILLVVVTFPIWLIMVAAVLNRTVLGWMFGLSLIVGAPLLILFFTGYGVGIALNKKAMRLGVMKAQKPAHACHELLCVHLSPILDAMRAENVQVRIDGQRHARSECGVNLDELEIRFGPYARGMYLERHEIDRSWHDPKSAFLHCKPCDCWLTVVHPEEFRAPTPWFPK